MVLDAKGKPCPQPVVLSLKALADCAPGEALEVLVDNEAAVENLRRMASSKGRTAQVREEQGGWRVTIAAPDGSVVQPAAETPIACVPCGGAVVAVSGATMGRGDEKLGAILMKGFLYALARLETPPRTVVFFNGGAHLTCEGSESLEDLRLLAESGTEILTCGTCLDFYGLKDKLAVGGVTNMYRITELLTSGAVVL